MCVFILSICDCDMKSARVLAQPYTFLERLKLCTCVHRSNVLVGLASLTAVGFSVVTCVGNLPKSSEWLAMSKEPPATERNSKRRLVHLVFLVWCVGLFPSWEGQWPCFAMVPGEEVEQDPRRLTSQIKKAKSVHKLRKVLDQAVENDKFNEIHASAAYHRLATVGRLSRRQAESRVLSKLHERLGASIATDQINSWACASIFWSAGRLFRTAPDIAGAIPGLLRTVTIKSEDMTTQALSNCMLTVEKLRKDAPEAMKLIPCLVKHLRSKAGNMKPQHVSNCLWAAAKLRDTNPDRVKMVQCLVKQALRRADAMAPQALSNCLWAAVQLKDDVPSVTKLIPVMAPLVAKKAACMKPQELANSLEAITLLGSRKLDIEACFSEATIRLKSQLHRLRGKDATMDVPLTVWGLARAKISNDDSDEFVSSVAERFTRAQLSTTIPDWNLCAMTWAYEVMDTSGRFSAFQAILAEEVQSRGLSYYDVQSSRLGRFDWSRG